MSGSIPARGTDGSGEWTVTGYTAVRELGKGASGRVVLAQHDETLTPVAVKYLSEQARGQDRFLSAFRAEARLLSALRSPHVVRLYEYVETPHGAAIVMELVDGMPLRALLRQEGATGPEAALTVLKGSLLGLADAHAAGVVHRDYKPENVLVAADGSSKLVDFGIALASGETGEAAGTPVYMAPEQWTGQPAGPATDVYAATATFFECLTGAKPYSGTTVMELAVQHMEAPIPDDLAPEPVRPLIRRGLAKNAEDRPATAADFVTELEAVATAAYGDDWEERGQRKLAALAALLPLLFPFPSAVPGASGTTALAHTSLGEESGEEPGPDGTAPRSRTRSRLSRRAKMVAAATMGAAVVGALTLTAVAAADRADARAHPPVATALSDLGGTASASASVSGGPSATDTASPTASASAPASASATASATGSDSPGPSGSGGGVGTSGGGAGSGGSGTAAGGTTGGGTGTGGSGNGSSGGGTSGTTTAPPTSAAPTLDVESVTIQAAGPSGSGCSMVVSVSVQTDGAADGTMTLTWFDSTSEGQAGPTDGADRVALPKGKTQISGRYTHTFVTPDPYPYIGVEVTTDPAADSGQGSLTTVAAPSSCNPIR